jgi:hypothetical protein
VALSGDVRVVEELDPKFKRRKGRGEDTVSNQASNCIVLHASRAPKCIVVHAS